MAIAVRATGINSVQPNTSTGLTVTLSAAPQSGDLMLCFISQTPILSANYQTIGLPFSLPAAAATVSKADWKRLALHVKTCDGTEGTSAAFTWTGSTLDGCVIGIVVYSGTSLSIGTPVTTDDVSSGTTLTIGALTTTGTNSVAIAGAAAGGNTGNSGTTNFSAWPNGMSELLDLAINTEWAELGVADVSVPTPTTLSSGTATTTVSDTGVSIIVEVIESGPPAVYNIAWTVA